MVDETAATNPLAYNTSSFLSNFNIDASAATQTFNFLQNKKVFRWAAALADCAGCSGAWQSWSILRWRRAPPQTFQCAKAGAAAVSCAPANTKAGTWTPALHLNPACGQVRQPRQHTAAQAHTCLATCA